VLELVKKLGADIYLSGPAAKAYLDEEAFRQEGISVEWMAYSDYPVYPQFSSEFSHHVSVLDLIFHCGPDSKNYIFS
jgi:hypothetical protein